MADNEQPELRLSDMQTILLLGSLIFIIMFAIPSIAYLVSYAKCERLGYTVYDECVKMENNKK